MTGTTTYSSLLLKDLSLAVHLGWTAEERVHPQEVRLTVELRFAVAPLGATSDELEDTICYATLSEALKATAQSREYRLIEKLGAELFETARREVRGRARIALEVHKVAPPVEGLLGGAVFRVGEFQ